MKRYAFENGFVMTIDFARGTIKSIRRRHELIRGEIPLFTLKFRSKKKEHRIISAYDFECVGGTDDHFLYKSSWAEVKINVSSGENRINFRAEVTNHSTWKIEWMELFSFGVLPRLKAEKDGRGEILFPWNEGVLVDNQSLRESSPFPFLEPDYPSLSCYAIFPNMLSSQFIAYLNNDEAIYLGFHDPSRGTKGLDFYRDGAALRVFGRIYPDSRYGEGFKMDYDGVLSLVVGDVYDTMDLYRSWLYANLPDGAIPIRERLSLPRWYGESPIVVTYPIRGSHDTGDMTPNNLYPYENAIPYLLEIEKETACPVLALIMHWEGGAPWSPPYQWPPFGGEERFNSFLSSAHEKGIYVGLYSSGLGYTIESRTIPGYGNEDEFEKQRAKRWMCADSDETIDSAICSEQRIGYDLCPFVQKSKDLFQSECSKMTLSGVDYVQILDQNHGGSSYFCFSDDHGHAPGPGKWAVEEMLNLLKGLKRQPHTLLGCESGASEPFIGHLLFSDLRYELNYYIGRPFPLYSYLYHEFVNNFMGNQICNMLLPSRLSYPMRLAYSFAAGDMLTIVMTDNGSFSECWGTLCFENLTDKAIVLVFLKNLSAWRRGIGKRYLNQGRMERPLYDIDCGKVALPSEYGYPLIFPSLYHSTYQSDGQKAQFIVNYKEEEQTVSFPKEVKIYLNPYKEEFILRKEVSIPPLSAIMVQA